MVFVSKIPLKNPFYTDRIHFSLPISSPLLYPGKSVICVYMPITTSAKKALRGSKRKRVFNIKKKDQVSKTIKQFKKLVLEKNVKEAEKMIPQIQKVLDKATKTGLLKKNTSSRKKSRLTAMVGRIKA
jgi:small subunit ribosomal protein S20